jgi:hypothetical protein
MCTTSFAIVLFPRGFSIETFADIGRQVRRHSRIGLVHFKAREAAHMV